MAKRRVGRYSNEFRRACVERMKQCDDISALSRELDIDRRLLYRWRDQLDPQIRASGHHHRPHANPPCVKRSANLSGCCRENTGTRFFKVPCKKSRRDGSRAAALARRNLRPNVLSSWLLARKSPLLFLMQRTYSRLSKGRALSSSGSAARQLQSNSSEKLLKYRFIRY